MRISKFLIAWGIIALLMTSCKQVVREIDLSGEWEVALDSMDKGISGKWYMESFPDKITLPGTLCDAGYGTPCTLEPTMDKEIFLNLKRKFDYLGPAWYKKECFIPAEWNEKEEVVYALDAVQTPMSLQEPVYNDGGDALYVMDQVSDKKNREENWVEELSLEAAMERLNERERRLIRLRFFEGKTQMEVSEQIGISQAQVSRLEKNALKTMRQYLLGK